MGNGSVFIELPNGEVFQGNNLKTARQAAKRAIDLAFGKDVEDLEGGRVNELQNNKTNIPDW